MYVYGVDESQVETHGKSAIATSLHNIGSVDQEDKGNNDEALLYHLKSLKIKYRVCGLESQNF